MVPMATSVCVILSEVLAPSGSTMGGDRHDHGLLYVGLSPLFHEHVPETSGLEAWLVWRSGTWFPHQLPLFRSWVTLQNDHSGSHVWDSCSMNDLLICSLHE